MNVVVDQASLSTGRGVQPHVQRNRVEEHAGAPQVDEQVRREVEARGPVQLLPSGRL
ncbi:MAG: hypothetical protein R2854_07115 [Caldilineaceae bacterium]